MINPTFFIVAIAIIIIWIFVEAKRLKHKIWAIFLIGLILFTYISFAASLKGKDIDIKTIPGIIRAGRLYTSWLSSMFINAKSITAYASKQEWKKYDDSTTNKTIEFDDIWSKL